MSHFAAVKYADSANMDSFGRLRVSNPLTLFDSKQILDGLPLLWDDAEESGSGTTSVFTSDTARTRIGVAATTAGKRTRQTFMSFNYQPGKSQLVVMTGVLPSFGSGVKGSLGLFNDDNGVFFTSDGGTMKVVMRSSASGSTVDSEVASTAWNVDKMDGTGPSGVTLDMSKTQIFWLDLEWLGVGRVRCGFVIDGMFLVAHQFLNANVLDVVYISTPNLPLRYQIENDGTGAAHTMDHLCSTVISEGGVSDLGSLRYTSTDVTPINANSVGVLYATNALRLKTSALGCSVLIENVTMSVSTNDDFEWRLVMNPTAANALTFSDQVNSCVQSAVGNSGNPSNSTLLGGISMAGGYVKAGGNSISIPLDTSIRLGAAIDGTRDEVYLALCPLTSNADVFGGIQWREL